MTRSEGEPTYNTEAISAQEQGEAVVEIREVQLKRALRGVLDALDRCAGDPPDCPHCGPAKSYALELLNAQSEPATGHPKEEAEQERVVLTGRAGSDPTFRTTPKGTLVGRFPLAVHGENNETTWYPVLAFNQRAEQLRNVVKRGASLTVVGYVHTRETPTRDGASRSVQEIYAVTVSEPRQSKQ